MGVPESEVMIVEAMYEIAKGRAVVGLGMSYELVNIVLRTGSPPTKPIAIYHGGGINQQEDQHEGCPHEGVSAMFILCSLNW